jgi:ABC-type lipoprotein export system ATPase subunit
MPVDARSAGPVPPLSLRDVTVLAPDGRALLRVGALDIAPGETVGIRGPSGAGKTTLLHVMAGLVRPRQGAVRWGETDLARLDEAARDAFRRDRLGLIFQDFMLFEELSPLGNAAIAAAWAPRCDRGPIRARAAALLARLGVPPGARGVSGFSGGERQRVAAARALAGDPAAVLADEPTASLDRASADRLTGDLLALARERGRTVIAVSHDAAVIAAMDRVIDVADGAVVGPGRA